MIVDLSIFMKPHSVKHVGNVYSKIVDCREEGKIWCNLQLGRKIVPSSEMLGNKICAFEE